MPSPAAGVRPYQLKGSSIAAMHAVVAQRQRVNPPLAATSSAKVNTGVPVCCARLRTRWCMSSDCAADPPTPHQKSTHGKSSQQACSPSIYLLRLYAAQTQLGDIWETLTNSFLWHILCSGSSQIAMRSL